MYSQLYAQMIRTGQEEIAASMTHRQDVQDARAAATAPSGRLRRRVAGAIAGLGVCVAAAGVGTISDASAHPRAAVRRPHVSAQQLKREVNALTSVGFVATSCEVGGTLMRNFSTDQSVLLSW